MMAVAVETEAGILVRARPSELFTGPYIFNAHRVASVLRRRARRPFS